MIILKELQFLHLCNHQFELKDSDGSIKEIEVIHTGDGLVDLVIDGAILLGIMEVRVLDYNKEIMLDEFLFDNDADRQTYEDIDADDGYFDESDGFIVDYGQHFVGVPKGNPSNPLPEEYYEPFLHNRIKWNVKPPKRYIVKAKIKIANRRFETYSMEECPRCQGKGWFVDILNQQGRFEVAAGITKVAQRIVKDFLTKLGSNALDRTYGTIVFDQILANATNDEKLFDDLRLVVSEIEDRYFSRQMEVLSTLEPEEILVSLRLQDVFRPQAQPMKVAVELQIITQTSDGLFRIAF